MQMNTSLSSLPQVHQRKDNIDINSAISGGLIHPEIKQEGKKFFCSFLKLYPTIKNLVIAFKFYIWKLCYAMYEVVRNIRKCGSEHEKWFDSKEENRYS